VVVLLGVALLALAMVGLSRTASRVPEPAVAPVTDALVRPAPTPTARRARAHRRRRPARPALVLIPAIGVRARVIPLGLKRDHSLEVPSDFAEAGWWTGGARPGERGPAVLAGHVDSRTGPAVFFRIGELRRGDAIVVVRRDHTRVRFTVQGSARYPKSRFPTTRVYGPTRGPALRLITCSGDFDRATGHYVDNTVVYAARR